MQHLNITVSGKVQGVWYRKSAQLKAQELGLNGFVKNLSDGDVYAEAEGEEDALEAFIHWCWEGPPLSQVENVSAEEGAWYGMEGFEIRR
ncbi:MAG TPA: acylphosphatase [Saprospiraceae bacterium]|nr:acylphosphatase [Saprospiraceae bacterium]